MLLEDVESTMCSRKQGVQEVFIDWSSGELAEPFFDSLEFQDD